MVITGDLFDGRIRLDAETISRLKRLSCPVYFVSGNHDGYSGARKIKLILSEAGVRVLNSEMFVHDGQLFPIDLINSYLFGYNQVMNQYKSTKVYFFHGSGIFGLPMRLSARFEIALYTFRPTI